MKKLLLIMTLMLAVCVPWMTLTAQNCREYSDSTVNTTNVVPFASASSRYSWMQMIYTSDKVGGTGTIHSVSFLATDHQPLTDSLIVVYMGTVTNAVAASSTGWVAMSNLTEVFRATNYQHLLGSGWETITLDVPFQYDGTANLVVCISSTHVGTATNMKYAYASVTNRTSLFRMGTKATYAAHPGTASGTSSAYLPFATFCFDGTCNAPGTPAATNITATSADVAWADTIAASYQYLCLAPDDTLDWTNAQTTTSLSVSFSNLTANTPYRFYVRSVCSATEYSNEVLTHFRTACPATLSVPCSFDFEDQVVGGVNIASYPTFVDCWDRICDASSSSNQGWPYVYSTTTSAHSGSKALYFCQKQSNSTNFDKNIAVLPQFSQPVNTLQLSFWAKKSSALTAGFIIVGVMTDPTDATTFTAVDTLEFAAANNQYTQCVSYFNKYTGTGNHIAICCTKNRTGITAPIYFFVDDVEVDVLPSCLTPGNLTTDTVAARFATISWAPYGQESAWNIRYRLATDTSWTVLPGTVTYPYTINNLIPNKKYEVCVRAACDSTDFSLWTQPMQFHTLCAPVTAEELGTIGFEGSEGYATGPDNLTNCWTVGNLKTTSSTFFPYAYNGSTFAHTGSASLQMMTGDIDSAYAILPEIDFANTPLSDYDLQFYLKGTGSNNTTNNDTLWIGVVSDRADFSTFQKLGNMIGNDSSDYIFVSFSFAGSQLTSGHIALFTSYNHSATATYANYKYYIDDIRVVSRKRSITVNVNDTTMGSVTGAGTYYADSIATLTATPAAGHHFVNWSNGATTPSISIVVTKDTTFTAYFAVNPTYLFEESDTICQGDTLTWHGQTITVPGTYYDSLITISGCDSVCELVVNWERFTVTAAANDTTMGIVTGGGTYYCGDTVTVIATAFDNHSFTGWSNGVTDSAITFVVAGDTTVTAIFVPATSVNQTEAVNYVAYVAYNEIVVTGAAGNAVAVFDMNGKLVGKVDNASDIERIAVNDAGVYIIHVENMTVTRVVVK